MKVRLEDDYRKLYTLEELDQAKAVIQYEKEYDAESVKNWAEMAAREALKDSTDCIMKVIEADARTGRNHRAWERYGDDTGSMDVWIEATVRTWEGFLVIGAYLSDIWDTGGTDYRQHMYIERFKKVGA